MATVLGVRRRLLLLFWVDMGEVGGVVVWVWWKWVEIENIKETRNEVETSRVGRVGAGVAVVGGLFWMAVDFFS